MSDTVNSCCQTYSQRKIWICGRIRIPEFYSGRLSLTSRDTNQRCTILYRPRNIYRRFISRCQALIRIYDWVCNKCNSLHMLHDAADKAIRLFTKSIFIIWVLENINSITAKRHINMHTGTIDSKFRLRHKCCMQSMPLCNRLNNQLKCHNIISRCQCLIIPEIYLMLCRCRFMMGGFNLKSHIFQCQDHIPPCILSQIKRPKVEVACTFM